MAKDKQEEEIKVTVPNAGRLADVPAESLREIARVVASGKEMRIKAPRRCILSVHPIGGSLAAFCNDGSLWLLQADLGWRETKEIPQPKVEEAKP